MKLTFARSKSGEYARYSSFLTDPSFEGSREMFLEIPAGLESLVGDDYPNALMILSVFECMKTGGIVHADAPMEEELLDNMTELSRIWALWKPERYKELTFETETYRRQVDVTDAKPDISAFSGGVDASYVIAHSLTRGMKPEIHIGAAVLIHGADIPICDKKRYKNTSAVFKQVYEDCSVTLKEYGIPLYPVRTNIREVNLFWGDIFFSVVVAAQRLFANTYARGVVGTDQTCDLGTMSLPWSENAITNPLYSTAGFGVIPLGLTTRRTERCSILTQFPPLLNRLRVCYQNNSQGHNCGVCEKCVRTKLNLMACGLSEGLPFRVPFKISHLRRLKPSERFHAGEYSEILSWDKEHGRHLSPQVVKAVERYVKRSLTGELINQCEQLSTSLPLTERVLAYCFRSALSLVKGVRRIMKI